MSLVGARSYHVSFTGSTEQSFMLSPSERFYLAIYNLLFSVKSSTDELVVIASIYIACSQFPSFRFMYVSSIPCCGLR